MEGLLSTSSALLPHESHLDDGKDAILKAGRFAGAKASAKWQQHTEEKAAAIQAAGPKPKTAEQNELEAQLLAGANAIQALGREIDELLASGIPSGDPKVLALEETIATQLALLAPLEAEISALEKARLPQKNDEQLLLEAQVEVIRSEVTKIREKLCMVVAGSSETKLLELELHSKEKAAEELDEAIAKLEDVRHGLMPKGAEQVKLEHDLSVLVSEQDRLEQQLPELKGTESEAAIIAAIEEQKLQQPPLRARIMELEKKRQRSIHVRRRPVTQKETSEVLVKKASVQQKEVWGAEGSRIDQKARAKEIQELRITANDLTAEQLALDPTKKLSRAEREKARDTMRDILVSDPKAEQLAKSNKRFATQNAASAWSSKVDN